MLAVARTLTATNRLLDVLPAVQGDPRVQVVFTLDEGSTYVAGARRILERLRVPFVPWGEAAAQHWDLAVSASADVRLAALAERGVPVLVVAHGAGHSRYLPRSPDRRQLAGLAGEQLVHEGRLIPASIGLSHANLRPWLTAVHPDAPGRAEVIGDPCHDRIVASRRHRDRYRAALGVGAGQRLVVLTSTWGPGSLLGRYPTLPARVLGALPADEYRVALVAHPNVWIGHGVWQVRAWLAEAVDAGLVVLPPTDGWPAALLAADVAITDHGSTGLYYLAAADRPLLLAAFGADELVPGTPADLLGRLAPRLSARDPLQEQVERAVAAHRPGRYDELVATTFGAAGRSLDLVRAACYRLLDLAEPPTRPSWHTVPVPRVDADRPTAYRVLAVVSGDEPRAVTLRRFPAAVAEPADTVPGTPHLAVDERDASPYRYEAGAVLCRTEPVADPYGWLAATLAARPHCRLAAVAEPHDRCLVRHRDRAPSTVRAAGPADPMLLASAGYALGPDFRGRFRLHAGDRAVDAEVRPAPPR